MSLGLLLAAAHLLGQDEVPLANWTVPPYTQPSSGGITTMADVTPPRAFIGIQPCRVADTRGNGAPIQGGIFPNSGLRNWDVTGICGIPAGADAISVNFSVVSTAATPQGAFLLAWPTGTPPAPGTITAVMTYGPGVTILSNAAIVPLGPSESLTVNVSHSTHVIMDVNGYFSDTIDSATNSYSLVDNNPGGAAALFGNSATASNSWGVRGIQGNAFPIPSYFGAGVRGEGPLTGVLGISQLLGVTGSLLNGAGGETAYGILGFKVNLGDPAIAGLDVGVFGATNSAAAGGAGVIGYAPIASGRLYGVRGVTGSSNNGAAGVRGQDGGGPVPVNEANHGGTAGVRGESHGGVGVLGLTDLFYGVYGTNPNSATCWGGLACAAHGPSVGVCGSNISALGVVTFSEPHPTDPVKTIRYISLEGNEAGTYFRGRGKFQNGMAIIEVPEDFRIVTDPDGLSIQVTPIGQMATVAVQSIGLDRIIVSGSRNVEFFYLVNGIRRAYRDSEPIRTDGRMFVPASLDDTMPAGLPSSLQERLISNGTYRADGTVNMDTARRLGWDKVWAERRRLAPQPTEP